VFSVTPERRVCEIFSYLPASSTYPAIVRVITSAPIRGK
jgi:hypothetical protein